MSEYKTKTVGNITFYTADHSLGNYLIVNNEFLLALDEDDKPKLSLEARGMYVTIMNLVNMPNWTITENGLAKICGCTRDRAQRVLKQLVQAGYLISNKDAIHNDNGAFKAKKSYVFRETIDSKWWKLQEESDKTDNTIKNFSSPLPENPLKENPLKENPLKDFQAHINNIIYKINKNINEIEDKEKKESESLQENNLNISNICEHETCDMDSPNDLTFSKNLNKNNNMENFEAATNLNNSSNFVTKQSVPKVKKSHKQFQQTNDDGTVIKNKMEYQMNQESKSLSDIAVDNKGKLGKQTEEERILAETKKVNKETQEALKEMKARKSVSKNTKKRRESEIFSLIEQDFTDNLRQLMHEYFDFLIQLGRPIEAPSYRAMLRILDELSGGDNKKKEAIVNQSLARGWQGFYALKDNNNTQKTWKNVQPVLAHQDEEEPEIKEFRDKNGNLITFG